jgi:hypothetical protein
MKMGVRAEEKPVVQDHESSSYTEGEKRQEGRDKLISVHMIAEDESVGFFRATTEVSEFDALP